MRLRALILPLLAAGVLLASAEVRRNYSTGMPVVTESRHGASGTPGLALDSIDFRHDLTRVYARISGRPHTSQRIDAVTLTMGRRALPWQDVDGIEMKRYFQFEDEGEIALEIDFPPVAPSRGGSVTIVTVGGVYTFPFR